MVVSRCPIALLPLLERVFLPRESASTSSFEMVRTVIGTIVQSPTVLYRRLLLRLVTLVRWGAQENRLRHLRCQGSGPVLMEEPRWEC